MRKIGGIQFILGVVVGGLLFGGTAAYAVSALAQPKTADVMIDGRYADMKGYIIDGSHYFQLRDISNSLKQSGKDFSVMWDGANNCIVIDTSRRYDPNERLPVQNATPPQGGAPTMTLDEMKAEIVRLHNVERVRAGLPELVVLPSLMDTAQAKADDFRISHYYGHKSPVYGSSGEQMRAAIRGVKYSAENLAPWTRTPAEAFAGWVESQAHYNTILSPKYDYIGVGIMEGVNGGYWWVCQFCSLYP